MIIKDVTLINPSSPFLIDERVFLPLGILYLASTLRTRGYNVNVLDLSNESNPIKEMDKLDLDDEKDIVGITSTTAQFKEALAINQYIKSAISPSIKTIIGGAHPSICSNSCGEFDYVIKGEGEQAILDIVRRDTMNDSSSITIQKPLIKNLNFVPIPARELIDHTSYKYYLDDERATNIMTSRGCPYKCIFCDSHNIWGRDVRFHSADYVLNEIHNILNLGYTGLQFFDDTFILNRKRLEKICDGIKKLDIKYRCFVRANLVNKPLLKMLKDSGCVEIAFGAESGSQQILDTVNKQTTIAQNTKTVELARELDLRVKAFLVIGLPGESPETVEQTRRWLLEARPDSFDYTILQPFPGTELHDRRDDYDISWNGADVSKSWYKGVPGTYSTTVATSKLTSSDIVRLRDEVDKDVKAELAIGGN